MPNIKDLKHHHLYDHGKPCICGKVPPDWVDALKPSTKVLITLGSIAVHVEELFSPDGRHLDKSVIEVLLQDPELRKWLKAMDKMAFLPLKRR